MNTKEEWRTKLDALPMPMEGPRPWESGSDDAYQLAAELTAKAMLIMADEDESLLDIPEDLDEWARADYSAAWDAAEKRWPGLGNWLGGITGFMFGWANQLVRWIKEKPQVGNPALITISGKE